MEQCGMTVTVARDAWGAVVSLWVCMRIPVSDSCFHDQREKILMHLGRAYIPHLCTVMCILR